jgi:glycosyltransferase involved in cell wall biosynthesis
MKDFVQIIFLSNDWDIDPRKHLLEEVINRSKNWCLFVLVQHVGLLGHFFTRFKQKILGLLKGNYGTRELEDDVLLFTPVILFHFGIIIKKNLFSAIDSFLLAYQINNILKKRYSDKQIILWLHIPNLHTILKRVEYDYLVYDYQDNFEYDTQGNTNEIRVKANEYVIRKSSLVLCSAEAMYNRASTLNGNCVLSNNGNNYDVLSKGNHSNIKKELSDINEPVIGYIGGIRDWIDFDLMNHLIQSCPKVSFVFVGLLYRNGKKGLKVLKKHPNFKWFPHVQHELLPSYLYSFKVGVIPFKLNKFTEGVMPNKFFEYMAAEIPIVSTALPELKKYSDLIGYARNRDEFLNYCQRALNGAFKEKVKHYSEIARNNTWRNRAETLNAYLLEMVKK